MAELVGTAFLLLAVVGSGIAASRLSPHDTGLALLENAIATGGALVAIILAVGPVSGAHLNPIVSLADAAFSGLTRLELLVYIAAQLAGAVVGVIAANLVYALPAVTISTHIRGGLNQSLSEALASLGLLLVIFGVVRSRRASVAPFAVGAYITGAYFFTSSTSFANPAVTLARTLSDTFAGIAPTSVSMFVLAQLVGCGAAIGLVSLLYPRIADVAGDVVTPHASGSRT